MESKKCSYCEQTKELKGNFHKKGKWGFDSICNKCTSIIYYKKKYKRSCIECGEYKRLDKIGNCKDCNNNKGLKTCGHCKETKLIWTFSLKDTICKMCRNYYKNKNV